MLLTIVLLLGQQVVAVPPGPCLHAYEEIARGAQAVFGDPTEERRRAVTRRLMKEVLQTEPKNCESFVAEMWTFADMFAVPLELRPLIISHPAVLSQVMRKVLTIEAQKGCSSLGAKTCTPERLSHLVLLDDPIVAPLMRSGDQAQTVLLTQRTEVRDPLLEWLSLKRNSSDRSAFLQHALESEDRTVRAWALDDAAGAIDPRTWNAIDVATLILEARKDAAAEVGDEKLRLEALNGSLEAGPSGDRRQRLGLILHRLGRMGFERTRELIRPANTNGFRPGFPHFAGEGFLCSQNWMNSHGKTDVHELDKAAGELMSSDCAKTWEETDKAALHPDLEKVNAALRNLDPPRNQ